VGGKKITHFNLSSKAFLAADQMCDSGIDVVGEGATVDLYPLPDLFNGTVGPKIPSDCNSETIEKVLHGDGCSMKVVYSGSVDVYEM